MLLNQAQRRVEEHHRGDGRGIHHVAEGSGRGHGGEQVPADARLVSAIRLRVNEASLTGESAPVHKRIDAVADDAPLADRRTMLYLGTHVAEGKGLALITSVGVGTELGRIASLIGRTRRAPTPLQERLARLGTLLLRVVLLVAAGVFVLGVSRGEPVTAMLLAAVTLAVAAIPEGLPTVATIALAVGVSRMARRHALVRRLPAVETLGAATVICTDKTGRLTRGEMTVTDVVVGGRRLAVTGEGYTPAGRFEEGGQPVDPAVVPGVRTLLRAAVLASDAALLRAGDSWRIAGDPTEGAIVVAAKAGLERDALHAGSPRIWEVRSTRRGAG